MFMGIPEKRLKPFQKQATWMARGLIRATKGSIFELEKNGGEKVKLYEGTELEQEEGGDPTGRLASLITVVMCKRLPFGDKATDSPEWELAAYILPLAKPVARLYVGKVFNGVATVARGAVRLVRRKPRPDARGAKSA
jgi:hypothetical protein